MGKSKEHVRLERTLHRMRDHGQGVWQIEVYHADQIPKILAGAALGDRRAHQLSNVVSQIVRAVGEAHHTGQPGPMCFTCDKTFELFSTPPPSAFIVITGAAPDPHEAVIGMLCQACTEHKDCQARVFAVVREKMVTDMRAIYPGPPGHA